MQTHEVFKAAIISIRTWEIKLEEEGILKKKPVRRSFKKLDPEKVKVCFAEQPDGISANKHSSRKKGREIIASLRYERTMHGVFLKLVLKNTYFLRFLKME